MMGIFGKKASFVQINFLENMIRHFSVKKSKSANGCVILQYMVEQEEKRSTIITFSEYILVSFDVTKSLPWHFS